MWGYHKMEIGWGTGLKIARRNQWAHDVGCTQHTCNGHILLKICFMFLQASDRYNQHCWCRGIMHPCHGCDPGSIPGQCIFEV